MPLTRRSFVGSLTGGLAGLACATELDRCNAARAAEPRRAAPAQIAITLDLEMSRNFPTWETTHWDYEKGNLNEPTKRYSVEAAKRVKAAGGVVHFFAVGRVFEQEKIDWLKRIVEQGHPVGNHTYDHVNVTAKTIEAVQFRFRRSPWLVRGMSSAELIRDNVRLCEIAMQRRLGVKSAGFRTPGGFHRGLHDHPEVRSMLKQQGFRWVSSLYPSHPSATPMQRPSSELLDAIVAAQTRAQPFAYPDGLIEIPMSPISDIGAFRTGRWKLDWFLQAIRGCVEWAIERGAVFDFLAHPSCMYVVDPKFKTIDMICQMVRDAGERAQLVGLDAIADRLKT